MTTGHNAVSEKTFEMIVAYIDREAGLDAPLASEDEAMVRDILAADAGLEAMADELRAINVGLYSLLDDVSSIQISNDLIEMIRQAPRRPGLNT